MTIDLHVRTANTGSAAVRLRIQRRISHVNERELRILIADVRSGRLSRRRFIHMMAGLGLSAPMAAQMLAYSGVAQAQSGWSYKPTRRGGGGTLKLLMWQGPTLLNPHFA